MSLYRTAVALSIKGDRVEPGTEIELTAEDAAMFDPADIVLVSETESDEPEEEEEEAEVALSEMNHAQLKAKAEELGLSKAGSKADLEERITLHLQAEVSEMVDHVLTEEDRTEHPEYFERPEGQPEAQVGDTIKIPVPATGE